MTDIIYFAAGLVCGIIIMLLFLKKNSQRAFENGGRESEKEIILLNERLQNRLLELQKYEDIQQRSDIRLEELLNEKGGLREELATLETRLIEERRQSFEKLQFLDDSKKQLKLEFENLAEQILEKKADKITAVNKERVSLLLNPLKEQITSFRKKVEDVYDKEARERHSLKNEIVNLQKLNSQMSDDAINLTRALKGDVKSQGAWGELVLERILESCGLQKGREYQLQLNCRDDEGKLFRPDVVINLPDGKSVNC